MIAFARNDASEDAERTPCRCHELPSGPDRSDDAAEMNELARELAAPFAEKLKAYREHAKLTAEQAVQLIAQDASEDIDRVLNAPPDAVSWLDLYSLGDKDANLALERWKQIKEAARNEIRIGYRAARAVEDDGGPCELARFLAIRAELIEDWQPRNTVEQHLVDQLAQWQVLLWRWQEAMTNWSNASISDSRQAKKGVPYERMRLCEADALERATKKVDLFHRLYLHTLKALKDQRRPHPSVAVRHAEQVNVGPVRISLNCLGMPFQGGEDTP
jgi:hypothetical protein